MMRDVKLFDTKMMAQHSDSKEKPRETFLTSTRRNNVIDLYHIFDGRFNITRLCMY